MEKARPYIVGGILVILVILLLYRYSRTAKEPSPFTASTTTSTNQTVKTNSTTPQPTPKPTTSTAKTPTSPVPVVRKPRSTTKPIASKPAPLAYLEALKIYKNTNYYIQFYPCQATPGSLTLKKGSKIMLDNRDLKTHTIGIESNHYQISAYNFAIATLNTVGQNYVTCDGGGSALIYVQP